MGRREIVDSRAGPKCRQRQQSGRLVRCSATVEPVTAALLPRLEAESNATSNATNPIAIPRIYAGSTAGTSDGSRGNEQKANYAADPPILISGCLETSDEPLLLLACVGPVPDGAGVPAGAGDSEAAAGERGDGELDDACPSTFPVGSEPWLSPSVSLHGASSKNLHGRSTKESGIKVLGATRNGRVKQFRGLHRSDPIPQLGSFLEVKLCCGLPHLAFDFDDQSVELLLGPGH